MTMASTKLHRAHRFTDQCARRLAGSGVDAGHYSRHQNPNLAVVVKSACGARTAWAAG